MDVLQSIARSHEVEPAAVAVAWLRSRAGVVAPISSARTLSQLKQSLPGATLDLGGPELALLTEVSGS